MFYTPTTVTISAGEKITGSLSCAPNARNNRDLDITIRWQAPKGDGSEQMDAEEEVRYQMCVFMFFVQLLHPRFVSDIR